MNTNINFGDLPNISEKLNAEEITEMNRVFNDPDVQKRLDEIESQRKIRRKWKFGIYGGITLIVTILSLLIGQGDFFAGLFFTIGSGDDTFSPVSTAAFGSYALAIGFLYAKFSKLIEIPLKMEVLAKLCPVIYSKLLYSHDAKYSFDELDVLLASGIISSYDSIDSVEDSMEFEIERNGKKFFVNGFELKTSEMRGSGRNRRSVTTNHDYLIKAVFPNARIPLTSDMKIVSDEANQGFASKALGPIAAGLGAGVTSLLIMTLFGISGYISLIIAIMIGGGAGYMLHRHNSKKINTNRVELENIEFEKIFDVRCADQVTSRMILTPAFMDRIVSFVHKTGNQYEFLFQGNTLYIKRRIFGSYLEVGTEKNILTNLSGFVQFYCDMREVMLFVHDMNLMYLSKTDSSLMDTPQEYHKSQALRSAEGANTLGLLAKFQPLLRFVR